MSSDAVGAPLVDTRYYEAAAPRSIGERVLIWARDRIYRDFIRLAAPAPTDRILDVGVSDVINDGANLLERLYPLPRQITAAGLGEGGAFRAAFPDVGYRQIMAGQPLPYADDHFDIAVSNAVIEHVGSREAQAAFIRELSRVAKRVFLSAPNRWFPVEHHTGLPLAHYNDAIFSLACKATGRAHWLDPNELILTDIGDLRRAAPPTRRSRTGYTGLPLGPLSSNLYLILD
ncbi:MAG: methyltransferase domain-containing protein [Caulobacteraceae bacterium]|nr:methyltransferase domain-containing protein [Caulobacteraceae bacterium]